MSKQYRVQVAKSEQAVYGQGEPLQSFVLTKHGRRYEFPDGLVVESSSYCDPDNEVASFNHDPPKVRTAIIEQYSDIFKPEE